MMDRAKSFLPAFLILSYWALLQGIGKLGQDHLVLGGAVLALFYGGKIAKSLRFYLPLILAGITYDGLRYFGHGLRARIRVSEPYEFDKFFFGITGSDGIRLTPNEWWQNHTHWLLDLITGFYYLTFVGLFLGVATWFNYRLSRTGTSKWSAREMAIQAPRMMWAFLVVNLLGYSTYHWYPAAPPWYVSTYGLGPANPAALPSAAGALRFDALLGVEVFTNMYSKSADVFGAIPSLHVAYPMVALLFSWRFGALRIFSTSFWLIMAFSAVYLNHHYILDVMWGSSYAALAYWIVNRWTGPFSGETQKLFAEENSKQPQAPA